jgi:putative ABC transport system permease protein
VILTQFLSEASMLCLIAGSFGLLMAYIGSEIINHYALDTDSNVHLHFSFSLIVMGLGLSMAIGIISGILPALGASKLDPVDALRYE